MTPRLETFSNYKPKASPNYKAKANRRARHGVCVPRAFSQLFCRCMYSYGKGMFGGLSIEFHLLSCVAFVCSLTLCFHSSKAKCRI